MANGISESQGNEVSAVFAKDQRARDAASAMEEYRAGTRAADEKTARLRALRLARDAAAKDASAKPAKKTARRVKRVTV
jgi:hypothetical protein